jgi:hypothetical protein
MGREGIAYTLVADTDNEQWSKLKRGLKQNVQPLRWEAPQGQVARSAVASRGESSSSGRSPSRSSSGRSSGRPTAGHNGSLSTNPPSSGGTRTRNRRRR